MYVLLSAKFLQRPKKLLNRSSFLQNYSLSETGRGNGEISAQIKLTGRVRSYLVPLFASIESAS